MIEFSMNCDMKSSSYLDNLFKCESKGYILVCKIGAPSHIFIIHHLPPIHIYKIYSIGPFLKYHLAFVHLTLYLSFVFDLTAFSYILYYKHHCHSHRKCILHIYHKSICINHYQVVPHTQVLLVRACADLWSIVQFHHPT